MNYSNFTFHLFLSAILCFALHSKALSQDCPNWDIELLSQADIDNFNSDYPNCTMLKKDLCIGDCNGMGQPYPIITSLQGLSHIEKIDGSLEINFTSGLSNLDGLDNIVEIGHNLIIKTNEDLTSLDGLGGLKVIGRDLELKYLPIISLDGLANLESINGGIDITANDNLISIDGLSRVESIKQNIIIGYNQELENLHGLSKLTSVRKDVHITNCPNLTDLQGLHNLISVGLTFEIGDLEKLTDLSGLENLITVGARLRITNIPNLQNLNGLNSLKTAHNLDIYENENLNSLEGLIKLDSLVFLSLGYNGGLESLQGLDKLSYVLTVSLQDNGLKDLKGFNNLKRIENLYVSNNMNLENLDGLQVLDEIGLIRIYNCNSLKNLIGFKDLIEIENFEIFGNSSLVNLEGLSEINTIDFLELKNNTKLTNLKGLNVHYLNTLHLINNSLLSSLDGLEMVDDLHHIELHENPSLISLNSPKNNHLNSIEISKNNGLKNLQGFNSITSVGNFNIYFNDSLSSLEGFGPLSSIKYCIIRDNNSLENIEPLQNIDPEKINLFHLANNSNLMMCNYSNICEIVYNSNVAYVSGNGQGCNMPDDFLCGTIEGVVVYDYNCNGIVDGDDIYLEGIEIDFLNINLTKYTSFEGKFIHFAENDKELHIKFNETSEWQTKSGVDAYQFVYDQDQTDCCNFNFLLDFKDKGYNAEVDISLPNLRCNDEVELKLHYVISGGLEAQGKVRLNIDPLTQFISADPIPTLVNGQSIEWDFPNTLPFVQQTITVTLAMPDETYVGHKLDFAADISLNELQSNIVDTEFVSGIVRCSFDPNDKQVYPFSENGYTDFNDSLLLFTVRFQNTGNVEAIDISIVDTISEHLDIESFKLVSTSHREALSISKNDPNVFSFDFEDIYLVDSLTDPKLSQGYIQYSLQLKSNLPPGTQIENKAFIFFDYNPAINYQYNSQ